MGNWLHRESITDAFGQQRCHWKPLPVEQDYPVLFTNTQFRRVDHLAPDHLWIAEPQPYCTTKDDLKQQKFQVCVSYGKTDGDRMTMCSSYYLPYHDMMSWLSRKRREEAKGPRHNWEYPYVYTAYPENWQGNLNSVLGKTPVLVNEHDRIVI